MGLLVVSVAVIPATAGSAATEPVWGMAGGYNGVTTSDLYSRGVRTVMVEMSWASAEPSDGAFSSTYFSSVRNQIAAYKAQGFGVILNYGMQDAPSWLLAKPNARFVNQNGLTYTGSSEPNLIWATELRTFAQRYTARVFTELGTGFVAVRVGGGHWGELTYPAMLGSTGKPLNYYWAFDAVAKRSNPVPRWKPGKGSPRGEARKFLTWYLNALTAYQNWQIATVRASYPGTVAVLYPSWGMRAGDFDKAVASNLNGTSSAEVNGEVQRGFDHARHIGAVTDPGVAVWGTWGENPGTVSWLAGLADAKGLAKYSENSGGNTAAQMDAAMSAARTYGVAQFMWLRASEAYCSCSGYATISDYAARIGSTSPSASPSPTASPTPTTSPSPSPTPTTSPSPSPTPTTSPSPSPTPTTSPSPSPTPTTSPSPSPTPTTSPSPSPSPTPAPSGPVWGMAGGFGGINMADLYSRGVRTVMVEMTWTSAEPSDGAFNSTYFTSIRNQIASYKAQGFGVILNYGMHHAPSWLLSKPNARYVNQNGLTYTGSDEPNLIWSTELRPYAQRYTARVFTELGTGFVAVRTGGGHWGELTYPQIFDSAGKLVNYYWAFDANAQRTNPVPGWKPGNSSPGGEASKFLTWYLNALTAYQNWQIATVRASYPGPIAVLYASWGMRSGDFDKAVATNLAGTSSPEINGEVQRGFDHARHIGAITDPGAAVWGTWAEKSGTISWLAGLANAKGLKKMGENSGSDDVTKMDATMLAARTYGLSQLIWIRAAEAYCSCNGYATISDYAARIASTSP